MANLSNEEILKLLNDPEVSTGGGRGSRGPRVDPTADRTIKTWFKLNHHMCGTDCEHRQADGNVNHRACWNPDCSDPRDSDNPNSLRIVVEVKGQWICRYCFLTNYLLS